MAQQSRDGGQVDRLDQAPRRIVAESVRVDVGHIRSSAKHCQQIAYPAVGVWSTLAPEHGPLDQNGPNAEQGIADGTVQRDDTCLVAFAHAYRGFPRARLERNVRPREADEFVDPQSRVHECRDDSIRHGAGVLSLTSQPLSFNRGEAARSKRITLPD
jgi:hypothetical protein